jgi:phenylalanyl-tRNA synthetase beta chain
LLDKPINISTYSIKSENLKQTILKNTRILPPDQDCSALISVTVENLTNTTVPKWITEKLISSGITPLNNLTDFQNYILLETGYPFAFYDFDKITSKLTNSQFNLSISKAKNNQEFLATNDTTYRLDNSILLIKVNEIPISIAGIIENKEFSYSDSTTSLLIEGSIFNAAKIRQQSRNLGLRTDRSTRYEKSLKNTYLIESLYRLISLLRILNPNLKCKFKTITKKIDQTPKPIY